MGDVQLHHVAGDDLHVVIAAHGLLQNGEQGAVQLHRYYFARLLGQLDGEGADAGADLQHAAALVQLGAVGDVPGNPVLNEKVLAHGLGKVESMAGQQGLDIRKIGQIHDVFSFANRAVPMAVAQSAWGAMT